MMPGKTCLMIITDGREGCLQRTFDSWEEKLDTHLDFTFIVDDSASPAYHEWLNRTYSSKVDAIFHHQERLGFGRTVRDAWDHVPEDMDYIFHLEDDFLLKRQLRLSEMLDVLKCNPKVAQIALYRQPWNQAEIFAGGFFKLRPYAYKDMRYWGEDKYYPVVEHTNNFTTNPSIYPRWVIDIGWPDDPESEGRFGFKLWPLGLVCLYWGSTNDDPLVQHFGRRCGTGY